MNILCSKLYEERLKDILELLAKEDYRIAKEFKMYLDTIILNMPSKINKYKKSVYFDDENIKDVEFRGCRIPFLIDKRKNSCVLLGITKKN